MGYGKYLPAPMTLFCPGWQLLAIAIGADPQVLAVEAEKLIAIVRS